MTGPTLLDLYCGAGGAAMGYIEAGFNVLGVDIEPQPRYPGPCLQYDVLALDVRFLRMFDAIHASPPCQKHTRMNPTQGRKAHKDLITPTRTLLEEARVPWVMENVEGARDMFDDPLTLCGTMFGLGAGDCELQRHRLFDTSFAIIHPQCRHLKPAIGVYGGHVRMRSAKAGGRRSTDFDGQDKPQLAAEAMGIAWMTMDEISQAIPPAYTRWIGERLLDHLRRREAA